MRATSWHGNIFTLPTGVSGKESRNPSPSSSTKPPHWPPRSSPFNVDRHKDVTELVLNGLGLRSPKEIVKRLLLCVGNSRYVLINPLAIFWRHWVPTIKLPSQQTRRGR